MTPRTITLEAVRQLDAERQHPQIMGLLEYWQECSDALLAKQEALAAKYRLEAEARGTMVYAYSALHDELCMVLEKLVALLRHCDQVLERSREDWLAVPLDPLTGQRWPTRTTADAP